MNANIVSSFEPFSDLIPISYLDMHIQTCVHYIHRSHIYTYTWLISSICMTLPIMGTRYYTANCPSTGSGFSEIPGSNPSSATYYTCFGGQVTQHLLPYI